MTQMRLRALAIAATLGAFALVTFAASPAEARGHRGRRGMHRGHHGKGHRGGPCMKGFAVRCSHKLFHSPASHLKQKLGLSDAQIAKIHKYRNNVWFKKASTKSKVATLRVKLRLEMEKDLRR
jgi:Spy/CpxP family protein refolding chaperone